MTTCDEAAKSLSGPHERPDIQAIRETARYLAAMTTGLADMARRDNLVLVAYFLDMAQAEAQQIERDGF